MDIELLHDSMCSGCQACANACMMGAIDMEEDCQGFRYPVINHDKCMECGACDRSCPALKSAELSGVDYGDNPSTYALMCNNSLLRDKSSSGGAFSLLSEKILSLGGYVYGAAFDDNWEVCHRKIDNLQDLKQLQGSKYVQSRIGLVYQEIKKYLSAGKYVLFSGTPCQCEGLASYLGRKYDRLYMLDLICHGVPSPLVWRRYVQYRQSQKKGAVITSISFRNKNLSWERYLLEFAFANSSKYREDLHTDVYMRGFLADLYLRKSCYNCLYRKKLRVSDITLADFWGIQNVMPEMYDGKGTSLLIVQSSKGQELLKDIDAKMSPVDFCTAVKYNPSYFQSPKQNDKREEFFSRLTRNEDIESLIKFYTRQSLKMRIRKRLSSIKILRNIYHCIRK